MEKISPSQPGVGRNDYDTWIAISNDSVILTGSCSCPAGKSRSCSHVLAIIYAVTLAWSRGLEGETCTDKPVAWGRGASKVLSQDKISHMDFRKPSPFAAPFIHETEVKQDATKPTQFLDHSE